MDTTSKYLIQADELLNSGKYKEVLSLLNEYKEKGKLEASEELKYHLIQSSALEKLGNYQESYSIAELAFQESQNIHSDLQSIDALRRMAFAQIWLGNLEKADKLILKAENLLNSLTNESLTDLENSKASIAFIKACSSWFRGDIKKAVEYGKESLKLSEKNNNKPQIAKSLYAIGQAYSFLKTDLDKALKYAEQCEILAEEINHRQIINFNKVNLGIIHNLKGEFEEALKKHKESLPFFEETNNIQWISATLTNIAVVYLHQGKFEEAVNNFEKSLTLSYKMANPWFIALSLGNIIEVYNFKGDTEQAKKYLEELEQLNAQESNKWIDTIYILSKAELLKGSPRLHDRTEAEKILKEVIMREPLPNLDINIGAIVTLCELLLDELRITNDIGVLDDLNPYIEQLLEMAKKNNSYWILTETYVLKAKLALITLDLKGARKLLTKAQKIAEKYGMHSLAAKVSLEHDELLQKLKIWEQIKSNELSLSERLKLTEVTKQMESMVQKRRDEIPEVIEENPVMILVITKGGNPTFSKIFGESFGAKDDLISSFLSAFNAFSGELFQEGLDRASFGNYTILLKPITNFLVCYLFKGQSFFAQKKIHKFVEDIEKERLILEKFNEFYETNRVIQPEDLPILDNLVTQIFIDTKID